MLRSMTGFGRSTLEKNGVSYTIEIKSVNGRFLDLNIRMPRNYGSIEEKIRKIVSQKLFRGKVDIFITVNKYDNGNITANLNESLAYSYLNCLKKLNEKYGVRDDVSASVLARFPDVITLNSIEEDMDEIWNNIQIPIDEAINSLCSMREREGEKLKEDIKIKCSSVKEQMDLIEKIAPTLVEEYRIKLNSRLKDLLQNKVIDESRVSAEVTIFADRACIDEEIVRMYSHISQMDEMLNANEPIGRKLDFLLQEMNREINTIASKTTNLQITNLTLNVKNEIEKIREQIQNIE